MVINDTTVIIKVAVSRSREAPRCCLRRLSAMIRISRAFCQHIGGVGKGGRCLLCYEWIRTSRRWRFDFHQAKTGKMSIAPHARRDKEGQSETEISLIPEDLGVGIGSRALSGINRKYYWANSTFKSHSRREAIESAVCLLYLHGACRCIINSSKRTKAPSWKRRGDKQTSGRPDVL
ncbi:hypothetical protein BDW71DRAFT_172138 [Aspergillus fruticulosus]